MERRILGNTGRELSIVGLGGVVFVGATDAESERTVGEAVDAGINYFDVAPSYGKDQETELRMGSALASLRLRDSVFLACKTGRRDAEGAEFELKRSLTNLQTDHFDLYQLHSITTMEDVDTAFGANGAMQVLIAAKEAGLIRHLGFSAHSVEAALAALDRFDFDSALFPINFVSCLNGNFGPQIIAAAEARGTARLALKAMARTNRHPGGPTSHPNCWYEPLTDPYIAELALRYTLSQPITAAVPPGDPELYKMAVKFAGRFTPITSPEIEELRTYASTIEPVFHHAA